MRFLRRLTVAVVLLLATEIPTNAVILFFPVPGAPSTLPQAKTVDYGIGRTVAVISALGDHITLQNNHFGGAKNKQLGVREWNLDFAIEATLRKYLSDRFKFKDIALDRAALASIPNGPWDNSSKFINFVKALPADGLDDFLIVRPDLAVQAPGLQGLGLESGSSLSDGAPIIWSNYEIDLVDARTGTVIATAYSRAKLHDGQVAYSGMATAAGLKFGDDFQLTPAQTALLRRSADSIISVSLAETLRALNLGGNLPSLGTRTMIPISPEQDPYRSYKSIAVISALGDILTLHHIGGTIFSQSDTKLDEPDWHVDAVVENRVRSTLAKRFQVLESNANRAELANAIVFDGDGKLAPAFPNLKPNPDIDLYVVIAKRSAHTYASNMASLAGLGVFDRRPISGEPDVTAAFAHFAIAVVDAHTMNVIAASPGVIAPNKAFLVRPNSAYPDIILGPALLEAEPLISVGTENWPSALPKLSADQANAIHEKVLNVINDSVDETLLRLALLGLTPMEGAPLEPVATTSQ